MPSTVIARGFISAQRHLSELIVSSFHARLSEHAQHRNGADGPTSSISIASTSITADGATSTNIGIPCQWKDVTGQ
jgi:hypothetical protein